MNVILSIKPEFADAIFSGQKKVEFRKIIFKKNVEKVFLYSSSPIKKITGYFTFSEIIKDTPQKLWEEFGEVGFINEDEFFKYFENKEIGFSICIDKIKLFANIIDPYKEIDNFIPPQSFRYLYGMLKNDV